ncbi:MULTISPECIES: hypothetical protein [Dethiosulfovibrio]|uniref:Uncharacterized protein n=2 Tax=Dethiosulfovibrio TaxID=47054 RepID=A0ABS9EQW7_9BACT|nr:MULTISPECIES: hypothetical protein [Dethiosulfovibrio]MCF4115130.1 hypothetical protein [Dethiosulfovibrio russensis]MCF4143590.1 hypothetical protein [Dethiosulfovibrio marinus]MCF4146061.1 hypothetical protein [Dethiosulfovibrio acidaminovorans]
MTPREELEMYEKALQAVLEGGQAVDDNGLKVERANLANLQKRIKELRSVLSIEDGGGSRVVVW